MKKNNGCPSYRPDENSEGSRRSLHLIDLENLLGGVLPDPATIRRVWHFYARFGVSIRPDDHVVVATSGHLAAAAWFALPPTVQRRVRDGKDGADLQLLDAVDLAHDSRRFQRLVIASGDGIFAPLARQAGEYGMSVHQVVGVGTPARSLLQAVSSRSWLKLSPRCGLEGHRSRLGRSSDTRDLIGSSRD